MAYRDDKALWWPRPALGDICWTRFPEEVPFSGPGPKPRPCLICKISKAADSERYQVTVAYGTSQSVEAIYPGEFAITKTDGKSFSVSHLKTTTKFDLRLTLALPYNSDFFSPPPWLPHAKNPKIGVLDLSDSSKVKIKFEKAKSEARWDSL